VNIRRIVGILPEEVARLAGERLRGSVPNPWKGFGLVVIDARPRFFKGTFGEEGGPLLVVAGKPGSVDCGGINGRNLQVFG